MPGPRRTLAAAVCAAVVGLFLVAGVGVAQATPHQRATSVHTSASAHQAAHVKATSDETHDLHHDVWGVLPDAADPTLPVGPTSTDTAATSVAPGEAGRPSVRGPPAA